VNTMDYFNSTLDPWKVLGVNRDADDEEIEKAWKKISGSRHKGDKIGLAYKMIATEESRAQWFLLSPGRQESLEGILEDLPLRPKYSGPGIWYKTLENVLNLES
jgi:hypothetical protein